MVEDGSPALEPLETSGWRPMYEEAAGWVESDRDVVDLGCGTGRFAMALRRAGHRGNYVGIDFSRTALTEAKLYMRDEEGPWSFVPWDLREWEPSRRRTDCVYTCLETLEHLEDDRSLVARVPPGHRFILSVPSYDATAHIRTFRHASEVWERYGDLLTFRRWSLIDMGGERRKIHLCDTTRRSDSWQ